jgi:hypothetical protein
MKKLIEENVMTSEYKSQDVASQWYYQKFEAMVFKLK